MSIVVIMQEQDFVFKARTFLNDLLGKDISHIGVEENLIELGIIDSLSLLSFLDFIEMQRSAELGEIPNMQNGLTLRSAYQMVVNG